MSQTSIEDINTTARVTMQLLASMNIASCLVGSAAGSSYGIKRTPNDVDILIIPQWLIPAEIKILLTTKDSRFSLEKPASNPNATYFILKYCLPTAPPTFCHVDIFKPGMIHLPEIPEPRIVYHQKTGLAVMPFFPVLLHKVQAWIAHRDSPKEHARIKQANDVQDIQQLLEVAVTVYKARLGDESWLPGWFLQEAGQGVIQYVKAYPETSNHWNTIGFPTDTSTWASNILNAENVK